MTPDQLRDHAKRIATMHIEDADYSLVYEDEDLDEAQATEAEMETIHHLVQHAKVVIR